MGNNIDLSKRFDIHIRVTDAEKKMVRKLAEEEGRSISSLFIYLINNFIRIKNKLKR